MPKPSPDVPLALGGHTFISQLGNEPMPSEPVQREIVRECLDGGITWFDTTHKPERVGLGRALRALGRRNEAKIIAWSFLEDVGTGPTDKLDAAALYEPRHIDQILGELQTDVIDCLVIHRIARATHEQHEQQIELASSWMEKGHVRALGVWDPRLEEGSALARYNPYAIMLKPLNVKTAPDAGPVFAMAKRLGWQTLAVSPFVRGWELDAMVAKAMKLEGGDEQKIRSALADLMLRFSLYHPNVDRVVTAMRQVRWVKQNTASVNRGPITARERAWLASVLAAE